MLLWHFFKDSVLYATDYFSPSLCTTEFTVLSDVTGVLLLLLSLIKTAQRSTQKPSTVTVTTEPTTMIITSSLVRPSLVSSLWPVLEAMVVPITGSSAELLPGPGAEPVQQQKIKCCIHVDISLQ